MEYKGTVSDAKTFLRALKSGFEKVKESNPNKKYFFHFALGMALPDLGKTDSEVLSRISSISEVVSKLAGNDQIHIRIECKEFGGIGEQIEAEARSFYEASKKLASQEEVSQQTQEAALQALSGK